MDKLVGKFDSRAGAMIFAAEAVSDIGIPPHPIEDEPKEEPKIQPKEPKIKKPRDSGDNVAVRLREMSREDILKWAGELGVVEKVMKHLDRPGGLGRMAIGNIIRSACKRKEKEEQ